MLISHDPTLCYRSIEWILRELVCAPLSYHVRYLVLPYLLLHTTIEQVINQATIMATSSSQATNTGSSSSPEMLYCLIELVSFSDGE